MTIITNKFNKTSTEIALIAPTFELADKANKIFNKKEVKLDIHISKSEEDAVKDAFKIAEKLIERGTKIIISRKGTAAAITKGNLDVSVVAINTILSDYIEAMEVAKMYDGLIAFFSYEEITDDVKTACYMLGIDAKFYTFKSDLSSEKRVKEAIKDGAIFGIGGSMTQKYADIYKLTHVTIENSRISIITALENAQQLLLLKKEELKKQIDLELQLQRYEAILNFTHDAIIAINEEGIIDMMNPIAEDIAKIPHGSGVGKNIDKIIKNTKMTKLLKTKEKEINKLMDINGTLVSTNRIPIIIKDEMKGIVATFQDVETIQENENSIRRSLNKKGLVAKYNFSDIIGESNVLKNTIEVAKSYAKSESTILILGETGTGKELFAQSMHNMSKRKNGPFVAVNCAALPKSLLESELFGYTKGAFTGATKEGKMGLFELAHKGTIFLDEIGEIPIDIQAQLLRVIQEREVRRIGSEITTPVDIRIITATNKDLKEQIKKGKFRKDLYYRVAVLNLEIPALRKRKDDIKILGKFFFKKYLGDNIKSYFKNDNLILKKLEEQNWYGNIRELENCIERISVLLKHYEVDMNIEELIKKDLIKNDKKLKGNSKSEIEVNSNHNLNQWEIDKIISGLKENNLSIQKTAKALDMSRTTLWRKMKQYNINVD